MKSPAVVFFAIAVACTPKGWQNVPTIDNLATPRPCTTPVASIWSDSLPLVSDTAQQHIVSGRSALVPRADHAKSYAAGLVRARFVIDTLGNVLAGTGIIEASSDEWYSEVVCQALPRLKFAPIVIDGRKTVVGLVHVPFPFEVN